MSTFQAAIAAFAMCYVASFNLAPVVDLWLTGYRHGRH